MFDRTTSYVLLLSYLLIPSQFIKLSYGEDYYCTVSILKQRSATLPSSTLSNVTENTTSPLRDKPSRYISSDDVSNHPYSFSSSVDVSLMMILTMMILPTILIIILTILLITLLMLPAVIGTHEEQDVLPNTNTVRPTTISITISFDTSLSSPSLHESSKRN